MKIDCVVVACNENLHYLRFWPIVRKAWKAFLNCDVKMVYIGSKYTQGLASDPDVIIVPPIDSWPTATQSQCVRLLYPSLLSYEGAVLISDMDMIPLQSNFFVNGFQSAQDDQFVSLRGIDERFKAVYMCYVGATPNTWKRLFPVKDMDDLRTTLRTWSTTFYADGLHAGDGWGTDQHLLYEAVMEDSKLHLLPNCDIKRLDRITDSTDCYQRYSEKTKKEVAARAFVDFHMPPFLQEKELIETILQTAIQGMHS
jgi:hypothetical protein